MTCQWQTLRARDVMNASVRWAVATETVRAAANRMAEHRIRALLVPGATQDDLPAILSSKDVVNLVGANDLDVLDQLLVEDACTRPAICVPETASLIDCMNLMRSNGIRRVPVLQGSKVVGILSLSDVFDRLVAMR